MPFDWIQFFTNNGVEYRTSGPNTSKNNAVIRCCWCGIDDTSMHLSISLEGHGFRCWRHPTHRGKNPAKLIQALLNCSWERANALAGTNTYLPNDFMAKVRSSLQSDVLPIFVNKSLRLPSEFNPVIPRPSAKYHIDYLRGRNIPDADIFSASNNYGIYYCTKGAYKGRIVFTVEFEGNLCGWTGRTIYGQEELRYKTLSSDQEKAEYEGYDPAPAPISHYLLWYDKIVDCDADTIILCEGPFDAWRVNLLGQSMGVVATCFFTSSLSQKQLELLHTLLPRFKHRLLLLDQNTLTKALHMKATLSSLGVEVRQLPYDVKDPGDLRTVQQFQSIL